MEGQAEWHCEQLFHERARRAAPTAVMTRRTRFTPGVGIVLSIRKNVLGESWWLPRQIESRCAEAEVAMLDAKIDRLEISKSFLLEMQLLMRTSYMMLYVYYMSSR